MSWHVVPCMFLFHTITILMGSHFSVVACCTMYVSLLHDNHYHWKPFQCYACCTMYVSLLHDNHSYGKPFQCCGMLYHVRFSFYTKTILIGSHFSVTHVVPRMFLFRTITILMGSHFSVVACCTMYVSLLHDNHSHWKPFQCRGMLYHVCFSLNFFCNQLNQLTRVFFIFYHSLFRCISDNMSTVQGLLWQTWQKWSVY